MPGISPNWTDSWIDPERFRAEQQSLQHVWTFMGIATDLARDGDWIRASIAMRSVFVERFGSELRGFENVCVHRLHPLRTEARGNGPVLCGFHQWQYNRDGHAVGIPVCNIVFGKTPH